MRKSFTQLFGFLLLSVFMLFTSGVKAQEIQKTVEVYAETVPTACYNVDNSYAAKISVRDFIGIKSFSLTMKYNAAIFTAGSASTIGAGSVLTGVATTVTEVGSVGTVVMTWTNATAQTIGDNVKTNILSVPFSIDGFPNNSGTDSFTSDLTWDVAGTNFYFDAASTTPVLTVSRIPGSVSADVTYKSLTSNDYSLTPVACNGGTATLTILNPAPATGMLYQFNGGAWQDIASKSVLAGPNTVRIQNASGCYSHLFTITVTEPTPLVALPVTVTNATCANVNGEVVFNFSGGNAPYAFYAVPSTKYTDLLGSVTSEKTADGLVDYYYPNSVIALHAGTYSVAVTSNGCQNLFTNPGTGWDFTGIWETVTITEPTVISTPVVLAVVINTCFGGNTGSIDIDIPTGGTGTYTASINDFATSVVPSAGIEFTGLTAKTYTIKVKDSNGCIVSTTQAITQPAALAFTLGYLDVTCVAVTKGKVWIHTATGGSGLYDYAVTTPAGTAPVAGNWKPVTLDVASAPYDALNPTYYSVYLRDRNNPGCTSAQFANQDGTGNVLPIQTPGQLTFSTNAEVSGALDVTCNGGDFVLTATGASGSGVYTYAFSSVPAGTQGTGANTNKYTLTGLLASVDVTVTVTDAFACSVSRVVRVDVANALALTIVGTPVPPTCPGGADGLVHVLASGSVGPYEYSVDNIYWQSQNDITITEAATTIWVRSTVNTGCKTSILVDIANWTANTLTKSAQTNVKCYGASTGAFTVTALWLGSSSITPTDDRTIRYFYSTDASKLLTTATGVGTGVTQFASGSNMLAPPAVTGLPAGTYYVWAVDEFGCTKSLTSPVVISQNPTLAVSTVTTDATCYLKQDGLLTITSTGGSGDAISPGVYHQYAITQNFPTPTAALTWKNFDSGVVDPGTLVPTSTQLISAAKGTYYVFVKDNSCVSTNIVFQKVDLNGYDNITTTASPVVVTPVTCNGKNNGIIELLPSKVSGGQPGYDHVSLYSFKLVSTTLVPAYSSTNGTGSFSNLKPDTYTLTLTDAKGCNPIVYTKTITEPGVLTVSAAVTQHFTCENSNDGIIHFNVTGGTPSYTFAVNSSANGTGDDITVWIPMTGAAKDYVATEAGDYVVYVKDSKGCDVKKSTVVTVLKPSPLALTKVVTPVLCNGGATGTITVTVTGGGWASSTFTTQAYQYKLFASSTATIALQTNATGIFTVAASDNYVVKVTTTNSPSSPSGLFPLINCGASIATPITEPIPYKYQATITPVLCKGAANGTFKVKVLEGGTPSAVDGYYVALATTLNPNPAVWAPTKLIGDPDGDSNAVIFTDLPPAIYTVLIKDANGCVMPVGIDEDNNAAMTYFSQESFEINEPATALNAFVTWNNNITCYNGSDGKFTVTAAGGSGKVSSFRYAAKLSQLPAHLLLSSELTAADWQVSNVFDHASLGATSAPHDGTFIIWVKDSLGCIVGGEGNGIPVDAWRVKISQPAPVAFTLTTNSPRNSEKICFGSTTGTVTASVTVSAGYPYTINVKGTSAAGVAVDLTNVIASPNAITMTGLPATETAHTEPVPAHSSHNKYTVTITDKNGCSTSGTIEVWQDKEIVVSPLTITAGFKCLGDNNGFIETSVTGGSGAYSYQLWRDDVSFSGWVNIPSFAVEVGHSYAVKVKDADPAIITPCEKVSNTINIVAPIAITPTLKELTCYGDLTASAIIGATGNPGRTYTVRYRVVTGLVAGVESFGPYSDWFDMPGDSKTITGLTFADDLFANKGLYYFEIKDNMECTAIYKKAFVPTQHPLEATLVLSDNQLNASLLISGGISPYYYQDGNGVVKTSDSGDGIDLLLLTAGAHVITINDSHSYFDPNSTCKLTKTVTVDPLKVTANPASGDKMLNKFDVVLTFNRDVTIATGDITVTGTGATAVITGTGKVYTVKITGDDLATVNLILANTIKDAGGNTLTAITYTYKIGDNVAPTVTAAPSSGENLAKTFTVVLTFSDDAVVTNSDVTVSINGASSSQPVSHVANVYTVKVTAADNSTVVVTAAATIADAAGNLLAGTRSFTYLTGDNTAPVIVTVNPNGGATENAHPANFEIFVNELVVKGSGKLTVYKKAGDVKTMELDISTVTIVPVASGYKVSIPLSASLDRFTDYYVLLSDGFVVDANGNKLSAIGSKTFWTFKTGDWVTPVVNLNDASLFKVYPNPFGEYVIVDNASKLSKIVVTNIVGQTVKEVVNPTNRIQLNELRSGVYFISLYNMDNVIAKTAKIVKR